MWVSRLLPLFSILVLGLLEPIAVTADVMTDAIGEPIQVFGVTQQDLNGDGRPDVTVIDCAFATERDQVLVYDQNGDMPAGNVWQEITDFRDDVWVFDASTDGTAQLIVDFDMEGDRYVAFVYDDRDGDGQVRYRVEEDRIIVEESSFWHVKVESDRAWTQPDAMFGANVSFLVDENRVQEVGSGTEGTASGPDGVIDWQIDISDKDSDGINDYQVQWVVNPILIQRYSASLHKTIINAQVAGREPTPYANTVFWPLLIGKHSYEDYRYFDHPPAIAVDWEKGTIDRMGILGFPIEEGYHIFSRLPLEKHTINAANFENPMAYYDMVNDQDGWPELQVRFDVAVPFDPYFPFPYQGRIERPNLEVNYSWDQDNDNRWDYKMNLGANYAIDEVVEFPDFAVKSVPYEEIIPWVKNRTWDVAMLVFDSRPSPDSEGMFGKGWMVHRGYADGERAEPSGVTTEYLMGFSDQPPVENYQDIQEGMRGEYSFQYFDTPRMYLSALDRQLHLSGAQAGVWNLEEDHRLRYANLSGDKYLDQWQDEHDGTVVQQLNYAHGVYVYSGYGDVRLKQTDASPALLETQPPGDYGEWQRLDAQLKAHQTTLAPEDFADMLDQLTGPEVQIQGATLRDYRITPQGFRFILELLPGFSVRLDQENLASLLSESGSYAVEYDGTTWSVRPATPASLRVSDLRVNAQDSVLRALGWTTVEALVHNDGLEDEHNLPVCATFDGPAGPQVVMTDTLALLAGEGQQLLAWDWAPPSAGTWKVQVATYCGEPAEGASGEQVFGETTVEVSDSAQPSVPWLISLGGLVPGAVGLLLFAAVALAGVVAAFWVRQSSS